MSMTDEISSQLKQAMRARDAARVRALRNIRAAFLTALKADGSRDSLPDSEAMTILRRLAKQRQESVEAYREGGREELAEAEAEELAVIEEFLPSMASEEQVREWTQQAIAQTGASSPRDMGKVMGVLMKQHREKLDGKLANKVVRELLAGLQPS